MKSKIALLITHILVLFCYQTLSYASEIKTNAINFFDKDRKRLIPVQMYVSKESQGILKQPVAIINHGYTAGNTEYSSIANALAAKGYFALSIQQDLKSDPPLARTGNLFKRRKHLWLRGSDNSLRNQAATSHSPQFKFVESDLN